MHSSRDHRPLVGRDAELAAIDRALGAAAAGTPSVVLLSGEPGVGKSRLITVATEAAAATHGARVLTGFALESGGMPPYFPLARAFGPVFRGSAGLDDLRPVLAAAGIIPDDLPPPSRLSPEAERLRLFDAVAACCVRLAEHGLLVLALDDLQWAEPALWESLTYLVRALEGAPVILLLAVREEALHEARAPAARAVAEFNRQRILLHLPLRRLPAEDVRELAAHSLGGEVTRTLGEMVAERSEGNPFFAEEILRDLTERRAIVRTDRGWDITSDQRAQSALPLTLRLAIDQRIRRLSAATGTVLMGGAVLGRSFTVSTLAAVLGWDLDRVDAALAGGRRAGLVLQTNDGWTFTHDLVREAVYETAAGERRRLHAAAARTLAATADAMPDFARRAALAYHWRRADEPSAGADAALAAAAAATAMHASAEALIYARTGRELRERAEAGRSSPSADLVTARLTHGEAALTAGDYGEAETALRAALTEAVALDDAMLEGRVWARLGVLARRREAPDEAAGCFRRALALSDDGATDSAEVAKVLIQLGELEGLTRARYEEADALGERALAMAGRLKAPALEASAALALAGTRSRALDPAAGRPLLQTALERALSGDDPAMAAEACAALSNSYYWTGELRAAQRYAERRLSLAQQAGDVFGLRHAHSWLALLAFSRGDWAMARDLLRTAEPALARLDSPEPIGFLRVVEAWVDLYTGDPERAYVLAAEAATLFEQVDPATVVWYAGLPALICAVLGRTEEARERLAVQEARLAALPESALPARSARNVQALAYAALGDGERGAACERALRPYAGDFHWFQAHRSLAALAALRGDRETALADLALAEERARREGLRPDLALMLLARADLMPARDTRRQRDLAEAQWLLASLEMRPALHVAPAPPSIDPKPAGLTAREIEVLRLVAEGKTNREIAALLVLSERTVINHLSNIFAKTGVDNRAGAAAFAFRHGLV